MPAPTIKTDWKLLLLLLITFLSNAVNAQEMQAVTTSKYGGINGITLNPSLPVLSPLYLDVNLATAILFVQNNYLYIFSDEDKISRFIGNNEEVMTTGPDRIYSDFYTPGEKYGLIDLSIMGPSASLMFGRHSAGIYSGIRSLTSLKDVPNTLAKFFYEGLYYPPQYDVDFDYPDRVTFGSMHWGEIGINYSGIVYEQYEHSISAGLTAKRLFGYAGTYAIIDHLNYRVPNYDTLIINEADLEMGLSAPVDFNGTTFDPSLVRGKGMGFDLGITYERKLQNGNANKYFRKLCEQEYTPYLFRVGFAFTDLGSIRFTKNSMKLKVTDGSLFWPGISGFQFENINNMEAEISNRFFGDPQTLKIGDEFSMSLPTTFNFHADLNLTGLWFDNNNSSLSSNLNKKQRNPIIGHGEWFVSSVVTLPLSTKHTSITRSAMISIATRYETRTFQIGVNATLWNYDTFLVGANIRLGYFFIGSDDLLSFMKVKDYTGTNLYAGIKFNLAKGSCRSSGFKCPDIF